MDSGLYDAIADDLNEAARILLRCAGQDPSECYPFPLIALREDVLVDLVDHMRESGRVPYGIESRGRDEESPREVEEAREAWARAEEDFRRLLDEQPPRGTGRESRARFESWNARLSSCEARADEAWARYREARGAS